MQPIISTVSPPRSIVVPWLGLKLNSLLLCLHLGSVQLTVEDECEELGQEPAEGNMEYKLKLVNVGAERLQHLVLFFWATRRLDSFKPS